MTTAGITRCGTDTMPHWHAFGPGPRFDGRSYSTEDEAIAAVIAAEAETTYPVELGGSMGGSLPTQPVAGVKARVNPGRPVITGPAVCRGCRSLVWWSGALWTDEDGTWHRCGR